ncbi:N-acetylmuramoyl-L-alanine amidase [Bacteroidales bacterium OttesenSCG-928-K03]|nr:N-acetylmuramoyl-L-alanine amidase [Odoribacter sp. OttesenSCG-928-L07]MDL2238991.1 N-acetylmuramoyl-L-alanine amidase [Bacteroidales bacterium OttesenSCG-928-L14]MDL2240721.1 N-acetylmuramoyl-L-alanine amidase [Bacteroidales bacterium OttesenSCG-928-K22]MDL2243126.1 N-acetylmuramoyl-L-alanine amidase [Bacteroidales bacterium OttesenSCG-928-K03]
MKRFFLLFSFILLTFLTINDIQAQTKSGKGFYVNTVIIDAGHGGKDPGAVAAKVQEKDITLAIAKKLGNKINKEYPDVKVVYTRDKDVFIELHRRASIANKNNGDLFISIHCNAAKNSEASGTETWVMGLEKTKDNLEIVKKENEAILYEEDYEDHYDGYDPNLPENNIIFSLYQNVHLDQSLNLSSKIQNQYVSNKKRNRGVKQGPFLVLYRVAMPSILTEIGFISNASDRAYINSSKGQEEISESLFKAFSEYKKEVEEKNNKVKPVVNVPVNEDVKESKENTSNKVTETVVTKKSDKEKSKETNKETKTVTTNNKIVYKVQFLTTTSKINTKSSEYSKLKNIEYYEQDGKYKYTAGIFDTEEKARAYKQEIAKYGFKDAFIVKFQSGNRVQ